MTGKALADKTERERAKPIPDLTASASGSYQKSMPKMNKGPAPASSPSSAAHWNRRAA